MQGALTSFAVEAAETAGSMRAVAVAELAAADCGDCQDTALVGFPGWASVAVIAMWVARNVVLYPSLWRAYDSLGIQIINNSSLCFRPAKRIHNLAALFVASQVILAAVSNESTVLACLTRVSFATGI
ncbi:MAG TPA: hypothetical protein ACFCUC_04260 [Desulfobacterales bacterium]